MRIVAFILFWIFLSLKIGAQSYFLNGDATAQADGCYTITPGYSWQNGTVWYSDPLNLNENFTIEFFMNFGNIDDNGADGMVFVLQTVGTSAIGLNGAGMGFQGFDPSFGIEFDTFNNSESADLVADHVAFLRDGVVNHNASQNLAGPVQANATSINIEDGADHIVQIQWNANTHTLQLFFDCTLRLTLQNNLITSIFGGNTMVNWGFTGATGYYYNLQTVCLQEVFYHNVEDQVICQGESVQLAATGNPLGTFQWSPVLGLDSPESQTPTAAPLESTTYCCVYTDLCNQQTESCIEVLVEEDPVVWAGNDSIICDGETMGLNAYCDVSGVLYAWSTSDGVIDSGMNTNQPMVSSGGQYVVTTTTPLAQCTSYDDIEIIEWELPLITTNNPYSICPNDELTLLANANGNEVIWFNGITDDAVVVNDPGVFGIDVFNEYCSSHFEFVVEEVVLPELDLGNDILECETEVVQLEVDIPVIWNTGENTSSITVLNAGSYSASLTVEDCIVSDTIVVEFQSMPQLSLGTDRILCEGDTDTLFIGYSGIWSDGSVSQEFILGEYEGPVFVTVTDGPCVARDTMTVEIIPIPEVDLGSDMTYCIGEQIQLQNAELTEGVWLWSDGSTESILEVSKQGEYSLLVSNQCGSDEDTVSLYFTECDYAIYAPNAFTPDDDGINELFKISLVNISKAELHIFDRFGEIIYSQSGNDLYWNGSVQNGEYYAINGVYTWQLKYTTDKLEAGERRGFVLLIR